MDSSKILFDVVSTNTSHELGITVWLDDQPIYQTQHVHELIHVEHAVDDTPGQHELRIELHGKTADHTELDDQGNIVKDSMLCVLNFNIDGVDIHQQFLDKTTYTHNFNGTQSMTQAKFYGNMGCNGTVSLNFSTPLYEWLLENM